MARTLANLPERDKTRNMKPLRQFLRYLHPYRWQAVGAGLALSLAAMTVLGLGQGLRHLVDIGFATGDSGPLDRAVLVLLAVTGLLACATAARFFLVSWIGERVVADVRRDLYDRVIGLDPAFFETTRTGEILSRLTTDVAIIEGVVGSAISVALRNVLLFTGGTVLLLVTSPKLTGLVFLVVPLVLVPILTYGRKVRRLSRASQDRVAAVGVHAEESLSAVRIVQAFTHEPQARGRFHELTGAVLIVARQRVAARALLTAAVIFLVFAAISVILWIGGHDVIAGRISAGDLSAFVFYSAVVAGAVGAISEVWGDLQRAAGASERILELLATQPAIAAPAQPTPLPPRAGGAALTFAEIGFTYPTRPDRMALDGFSLTVAPGEKLALVGPSGAGKSTIFQLALRFYDPQQGCVRLDGVDLRCADPRDVRGRIGLVPQDAVIFSGSVAENLRYGKPDASEAELRAALSAAHASDFVEKLPGGLDCELGERGVRLSGGQRQRIAIARALLRDPALLLLDEATSALDAESERAVQAALAVLMEGRTSIVIAHRLATVLNCDRIVVIDHGRIVEAGTHASLVAQGGLYARLAELQFDPGLTGERADPGAG